MSEPSLCFTLAHIYRCSCCFLICLEYFTDLKENLQKIVEGNVNPLRNQEKNVPFYSKTVSSGFVVVKKKKKAE